MSTRPTDEQMNDMTALELIVQLIVDTSWADRYRKHLLHRSAIANQTLSEYIVNHVNGKAPNLKLVTETVEDTEFMLNPKNRIKYFKALCEILIEQSSFSDPVGAMRMHPQAARNFIVSLREREKTYNDLSKSMADTFWMICDSFSRELEHNTKQNKS